MTYTARPDETVRAVAARLDREAVGTLVVTDDAGQPIGMVTDRDVAVRCVGRGLDAETTTASVIMSTPVKSVHEDTPIEAALKMMAGARVRRCAVVDSRGALVGVLTLDDVLDLLAEEAATIGALLRVQAPRGQPRPGPGSSRWIES